MLLFFYSSPCYLFMFFSSTIYYLFSSDANFGLYNHARSTATHDPMDDVRGTTPTRGKRSHPYQVGNKSPL
jgi:hypothetical protein